MGLEWLGALLASDGRAHVLKNEEQELAFASTRTLSIGNPSGEIGNLAQLISMLTILTEINKYSYYLCHGF